MSTVAHPAPDRIVLGRVPVDPVTQSQALDTIARLIETRTGGTVFTPNVDHFVIAEHDERFRAAYAATRLSLVDGTPVLWALRMLGHRVPAKVSGSDLAAPLMGMAAEKGWRVYFLGAGPGVGEIAAERLRRRHPRLQIVGIDAPLVDMTRPAEERHQILERCRATSPDLVLVALGTPKGELLAHEISAPLAPAVVMGVGASLDFIAGTVRRAPAWMSRMGVEWLFRLFREPRRLWRRYLIRDPEFALIVLRAWRRHAAAS